VKSPAAKPSMIRSSVIFAALTLVSRFMGLARDLVITSRLGASLTFAADAYYTALTFPNLFRRIFAEGAFAAAFVPSYSAKLAADGDVEADQFAADALATLAALTVGLAILCIAAMPWLMYLFRPGYTHDPDKFKLAIVLTQITMMYLPCMAIAALFSGVLNARDRFVISGFYPTVLNAVMLVMVLPQHDPVHAAYAASFGVLIAGVGQMALVAWGARKAGARIDLRRPTLKPEIKALIGLAAPAALANSATQINIFISGILASQINGMLVWMNVADRLYQLPMSLVGVAIGIALLPRLSKAFQTNDHDDAQAAMDQGIVFALAFSLPAAAALMAMPAYLIDGFFVRGAFTAIDAAKTGALLFHYGWGVPAFVLIRILQPAFFARHDTRTPMRFSLISVAVNVLMGVLLFYMIGFQGIAIATSLASWITVAQMAYTLSKRGLYRPSAAAWGKIIRVAAASVVLGLALAVAVFFRTRLEAPFHTAHMPAKELVVLLLCLLGGLGYPALLIAFGGLTLGEIKTALRRKRSDLPIANPLP
jgi:putative peptidoglycan lipid II flippase